MKNWASFVRWMTLLATRWGCNKMRRTKEDADKTREAILMAALNVFYKKGVSRATLADIGKEAGVTRGAVYWHFKDKIDLFLQLDTYMANTRRFTPEYWSDVSITSLSDLRQRVVDRLMTFFDDPIAHKFQILIFSRMEYIEDFKEFTVNEEKYQRACILELEKVLTRLMQVGEIRSDINPRHAARHFYVYMDGLYDCWSIDETEFVVRDELEELTDEFMMLFKPV
jgi:TetR/AcrR family transcriptional regulator, acrAB operon repressor